jgi:hypothetical protein
VRPEATPGGQDAGTHTSAGERTPRVRLAGAFAGSAVVLAVLALVLSYAGRTVLRAQPFADRTVAALSDPAVRADVADHLTDAVVRTGSGDLAAIRPLIRTVVGAIVGNQAFAALFRRGVIEAHASVVDRRGSRIVLTVADAGVLVQGLLRRFAPQVARRLDVGRVAALGSVRPGGVVLDAVRLVRRIYAIAGIFGGLAAVLALGALALAIDRRRAARRLGFAIILGGLVIALGYEGGAAVAGRLAAPGRAAVVQALWRIFLHGLLVQGLWMAGAGVVLAAVAAAAAPRAEGEGGLRAWQPMLRGTGLSPGARLARSVGFLAAAAAILLEPARALAVAAVAGALIIAYMGLTGVLAAAREVAGARTPRRSDRPGWGGRVTGVVLPAAIAVAALVGGAAVIATGSADEAPAATPVTCNGYTVLCDRPLNDVSFAATHNSMASVTIPTWNFGQQDGTIADQLAYGIRGFLIDTYYGYAVKGGVRTDLATLPKRELAVKEIGKPAVQAAERIRARIGGSGGTRGIFLCHGFCELGAVPLSSALKDLRMFLVSNPGAVVIVVNQDEGVAPADIARAFEQAGLLDLVYRGPLGPFPRLRDMIDSGQRLVVMAENDAGAIPWYHLAYLHALQETPFTFKSAAELTDASRRAASCAPNRGPDSAPLFLLNHWVDTTPVPRASLAAVVNAHAALLARAQACRRIRHRLPNLVAVDFYRRGDVLGVVRALNGIGT